ncbi:MAG TPA: 4-hydroxy-tetrahydrodipicolinate synthase [Actinomycetales bacterium]|nr:4-hydroxy-tetrahydrodipicolinate synthase [Actinomycetales bacterium]
MSTSVATSLPRRPFGAVITAMATPMLPSGAVDFKSARQLAAHLVSSGHDAIVLSGTTGESPTTHSPDKIDLIRAVVAEVGQSATVIAGAGSNDTAHTVRMARDAETAGAQGLLVVTPYYSKPSQEGVYRHITAVADATDLPVMLYDIPGRTSLKLSDTTIERLAEHDRIVALKDATGDVFNGIRLMQKTGLAWYSGDDGLNLPFLALGASGMVSVAGHAYGRQLRAMVDAVDAGDLATARQAFTTMAPFIEAIDPDLPWAVAAKAAAQILGVIAHRCVRLPLVEAREDQVQLLAKILDDAAIAA